jgi:hypothetical protein
MNITKILKHGDDYLAYPLEILVGKIIASVEINAENNILKITEKQNDYYFYTESDCCSETWIEHISTDLTEYDWENNGGTILTSEDKRTVTGHKANCLGNVVGTKQEVDQIYVEELEGTHGSILTIEYRNSSNGYYGGSLVQIEKPAEDITFRVVDRF